MGMGIGVVIGALICQVMWLAFCFGTVVVGVLMLFIMPAILIAPGVAGVPAGLLVLGKGFALWNEGSYAPPRTVAVQMPASEEIEVFDESRFNRLKERQALEAKLRERNARPIVDAANRENT